MAFLVKPGKSAVMVMLLYALFGENVCQGKLDEQFDDHFRSGMQKRTAIDADRTIEKVVERQATPTEAVVTKWLEKTNKNAARYRNEEMAAKWNSDTNITDHNSKIKKEKEGNLRLFLKNAKEKADSLYNDNLSDNIKRQLKLYGLEYASPNDPKKLAELLTLKDKLGTIYSTATTCYPDSKSCKYWGKILPEYPGNALAWKASREHTAQSRGLYIDFVTLQNTGATDNGFRDRGDYWRKSGYETANIGQTVEELYNKIKPMYQELHAYMRRKIKEQDPDLQLPEDGPIPDHLFDCAKVKPYPDAPKMNIKELIEKKFDVTGIAKNAENYFKSMGLYKMTEKFWKNSMFEKPVGRNVSCHGLTFGFRSRENFRVKYCGKADPLTMHVLTHEMGHIEYHMAYRNQTDIYRAGANEAFHEAVADLLYIPYGTQDLLRDIFETKKSQFSEKNELNSLMHSACKTLKLISYGYAVDKWRWGVYDGSIPSDKLNRGWWEMMLKYVGVIPPVKRTEKTLDAATLYHVPYDWSYLRYVIAGILKYQFYEALCNTTDHTGELHKCNFYRSRAAGDKLKSMMKMGRSKPWEDALEVLTDQREISVKPLLEYIKPITKWIKKENRVKGETIRWMAEGETAQTVIDRYIIP